MLHREAYVLHTRPWRDTGLLVDFLVCDRGRLRAIARGIRGRRRGGNPCQLFQPLLVEFAGQSALKQVRQLEAHGARHALRGQALFGGLYANELLLRSLAEPDLAHAALFDAYTALLAQLAASDVDLEPPLRQFERTLLAELGYGVDFAHGALDGQPLRAAARYAFIAEVGFVPVETLQSASPVPVYSGAVIQQVANGELSVGICRRCAKQVMRVALRAVIGDAPLRSRALFRSSADR